MQFSGPEEKNNMPFRVVVDTNVFISAIIFEKEASKLVSLWRESKIRLLISRQVLEEYINVLSYPKFKLTVPEIEYIVKYELLPYAESVKVKSQINIIKDDPDDNKFLSLAVDGNAGYIISGDKHFLKLKEFKAIKIFSLREFLRFL